MKLNKNLYTRRVYSCFLALAILESFTWNSFIQPSAVAQSISSISQKGEIRLAQIDLSRPIERKFPGIGGTVLTGFRYNPTTKEVGLLLSGDHVIKPIIEKQEEQKPKYTNYNRVTINSFRYKGINVERREIEVDARVRYQKLEDKPWGGRYTTFDQASDIRLGANFEVKDRELKAATYIRNFKPDWASGLLGYVYSIFDAAFGAISWVAEGKFTRISDITGALGAGYVNLAQPQKEIINSMLKEVNEWNSQGLVYLNRTDYDSDGIWLMFKADQNQVDRLWQSLGDLVSRYFPGLTINNQLNLVTANSLTPTTLLQQGAELYRTILGREPEPGAAEGLASRLANGSTLAREREIMANSEESRNNLANLYRTILGREPEPGAVDGLVSRLANGSTLAREREIMTNSDEARKRRGL